MAKRTKKDLMKEAARMFGSLGGQARARKLSPEERSKIARKAIRARWRKAKGRR